MRNISCSLTTQQIRDRTKTVTRRLGWKHLKPGDLLCICEKCMGRKPWQPLVRIAIVRVVDVSRESLWTMATSKGYGDLEAAKEGFAHLDGHQFARMFCDHMGCSINDEVTRIEFRYLPGGRFRS